MRYTFFEFKNFKGIRHARIDLSASESSARIYTLVGLNESGKTTVLEGIDQFQGTEENEISPKALAGWVPPDPGSNVPVADQANFNGSIEIRCGIELENDDVMAASDHLREHDGYRLEDLNREIEISDKYRFEASRFEGRQTLWLGLHGSGKTKKGRKSRAVTHEADPIHWNLLAQFLRGRLPSIWFFPNFLFEFPTRIYLEEYSRETDENRFYRSLFQDILNALDPDLSIDTHIVERLRSGKSKDRNNLDQVLLKASRHVTHEVVRSWNRIFVDRPIDDKRVLMKIDEGDPETAEDGTSLPGRISVVFQIEDGDGIFTIRERSLGFRWFFVYLMVTTYRGQNTKNPSDMLFLFDEPASNLHPTAQNALLSSLQTLAEHAGIIYTTHSHHLINPAWLGTTFVVANEGLGEEAISVDYSAKRTDIQVTPYRQFAAHHPEQSHFFQPILEVLDYAPSDLEFAPSAAMVEGKSDYYVLSYFQQVIEEASGQALALMPGGGAGTLDSLIQLYLGWSRPFVILLDSDAAGKRQRQRYLNKFGPILEPSLVSLSEASGKSSAKGIESLLYESDLLRFQQLIDPHSDRVHKRTFLLGVQEALVARRRLDLTKTSRKNVARTVNELRSRLAGMEVPGRARA